jgi:hypothetical protein
MGIDNGRSNDECGHAWKFKLKRMKHSLRVEEN